MTDPTVEEISYPIQGSYNPCEIIWIGEPTIDEYFRVIKEYQEDQAIHLSEAERPE